MLAPFVALHPGKSPSMRPMFWAKSSWGYETLWSFILTGREVHFLRLTFCFCVAFDSKLSLCYVWISHGQWTSGNELFSPSASLLLTWKQILIPFDWEIHIDSDTTQQSSHSQVGDSGLKIPCISAHHSLRQIVLVSCVSQNICDTGAFCRYSLQPLTWTKFQGTLYVIHKSVGHVASEIIENYC